MITNEYQQFYNIKLYHKHKQSILYTICALQNIYLKSNQKGNYNYKDFVAVID